MWWQRQGVGSSSQISSETEGNFDLKFGDVDADEDLVGSGADLFASSNTPPALFQDFGDYSAQDLQTKPHTRKRKMDNEGFVTPATPDIPKSSVQFGMASHADFNEPANDNGNMESEDLQNDFVIPQQQQQQQQQRKKARQQNRHDEEIDMNTSSSPMPDKKYEAAVDLFEDLAQGTKMLIIQMAQNFRESEEYESLCLANVESLLREANELENSLRHQKDLLQQRIFLIGRRLSSDSQ